MSLALVVHLEVNPINNQNSVFYELPAKPIPILEGWYVYKNEDQQQISTPTGVEPSYFKSVEYLSYIF